MSIPAHVPKELVYEFDHITDPGLLRDPHKRFLEIASLFPGGLFYSPCHGGFWVTTNYNNFVEVAVNYQRYSSKEISVPPTGGAYRLIPVNIDPPEHVKYRRILAKQFSPPAVRHLEDEIRGLANQLIDKLDGKNNCDFVQAFAEQLPVTVFMKMMGLPLSRLEEFREWAMTALAAPDVDQRFEAMQQITEFMNEAAEARRKDPQDDIISDLLSSKYEDRLLTSEELQSYCLLLFLAGLDTVVNAMSFGMRHLAGDKMLQQKMRKTPDIAPSVVEESLRRYSFVNGSRLITEDHQFSGQELKKGEMIMFPQVPANLDPLAFDRPLEFMLDRKGKNRHVAFNTGPHNCMGSHLARVELALVYQEWCKRIPDFSEDSNKPPEFAANSVMGMRNLHLVW